MKLERLTQVWSGIETIAAKEHAVAIGAADLRGDEHASLFREWLAAGHHGTMHYLEKAAAVREAPESRFPWARSAIVILVPYESERPQPDGTLGSTIARYALGDDYHLVLEAILKRFESYLQELDSSVQTRRYVDTGPLSDRTLATTAGLGWIGRNSMLIHEQIGSYTVIGTLLTSLENDLTPRAVTDRCGSCTRCVDACPTDAILPGRTVDSTLCLSHANIEQRGAISDLVKQRMGENLFGCDICQEVCPWNRRPPESHPSLAARADYRATPISDLLRMEQAEFSAMFRRSAVKRAKRAGILRNALVVTGEIDALTRERIAREDDPGIRDAMSWLDRNEESSDERLPEEI